jgi:hypothetical protein
MRRRAAAGGLGVVRPVPLRRRRLDAVEPPVGHHLVEDRKRRSGRGGAAEKASPRKFALTNLHI